MVHAYHISPVLFSKNSVSKKASGSILSLRFGYTLPPRGSRIAAWRVSFGNMHTVP